LSALYVPAQRPLTCPACALALIGALARDPPDDVDPQDAVKRLAGSLGWVRDGDTFGCVSCAVKNG
jgi:hypothetical protein